MNFINNITFRRKRTYSDPNTSNISEASTHTLDNDSVSSMPDESSDELQSEVILKLKQQINKLESELNIAHQEIETLSQENTNLKRINITLQDENNQYKTIKNTPNKTKTPNTIEKNRRNKKQKTLCEAHSSPSNPPATDQPVSSTPTLHQKDIKRKNTKSKIHILSTDTRNKILSICQKTLSDNYTTCHYLKPNCNTEQLIHNLETIVQDFTINDFCVILIGEDDFKNSRDYFGLIFYIREILQKLNHTNIIICAPTYKYGYYTNMFNWRVENFNNLLYFDILEHKHAYFLDSNKNLKCSYEMFNIENGKVNNLGMETIFQDIRVYIDGIIKYDIQTMHNPTQENQLINEDNFESESMFFRD